MRFLRFTTLEILLTVPVCALFLTLNLASHRTESQFTPFNSTYFFQALTKGWPMPYQSEHSCENKIIPTEDDLEAMRAHFLTRAGFRVTSPLGLFANSTAMLAAIAGIHLSRVMMFNRGKGRLQLFGITKK